MRLTAPLIALSLSACSSGGANHLGNPLLLPGAAVLSGIENAIYSGERAPVETFVTANYDALLDDIDNGGGADLTAAFDIAGVAPEKRAEFVTHMEGYDLSHPDNLVAALMVWRG